MVSGRGFRALSVFQSIPKLIGQRAKGGPWPAQTHPSCVPVARPSSEGYAADSGGLVMIDMRLLDMVHQDARYAVRLLLRAKAFTTAAVLTLALGIAATTVMFALIQGVLLRPLPVQEEDRLILSWREAPTAGSALYPFGDAEIEAVARESQLLESAAGVTRNGVWRAVVSDGGTSSYANVGLITGGFFEVLGAQALLGRR